MTSGLLEATDVIVLPFQSSEAGLRRVERPASGMHWRDELGPYVRKCLVRRR